MHIVFRRTMTQKYRAILHFIDPIVSAGHKLTICISAYKFKQAAARHKPTNVGKSSKDALKHLEIGRASCRERV